jgi:hypothetical protein
VHFSESALTLKSGDTGLTLNFWKFVIKEILETLMHAILSEVSMQLAGTKRVCSGGASSVSTTIKEAVVYIPLNIPCDEGGSVEDRVHLCLL